MLVPKKVFFTRGVGVHKKELQSFELALRDAGVETQNLVTVSSIFPPKCKVVSKEKGVKELEPGQITFCVMSRCSTNEHGRLIGASVGFAIPSDTNSYGYLSEHHAYGQSERVAGDFAEDLAVSMLSSTLGLGVDEEIAWDDRKEIFRLNNKIVKTSNVTQTALGKHDRWTSVVAMAVFIL